MPMPHFSVECNCFRLQRKQLHTTSQTIYAWHHLRAVSGLSIATSHQVRSGIGIYEEAARCRVHLTPVLLRNPSGNRPGSVMPVMPISLDRIAPDATIEPVDASWAWSSKSDLGKKESDGRDFPQRVALPSHA